jgi:hypothetical protein
LLTKCEGFGGSIPAATHNEARDDGRRGSKVHTVSIDNMPLVEISRSTLMLRTVIVPLPLLVGRGILATAVTSSAAVMTSKPQGNACLELQAHKLGFIKSGMKAVHVLA